MSRGVPRILALALDARRHDLAAGGSYCITNRTGQPRPPVELRREHLHVYSQSAQGASYESFADERDLVCSIANPQRGSNQWLEVTTSPANGPDYDLLHAAQNSSAMADETIARTHYFPALQC